MINYDFYEEFEIDLTGYCNLHCDRCSRNYLHSQHLAIKNVRPLDIIIKQLEKFKNLKRCFLAGQTTEPTSYPYFIDFLKYLKSRKIRVDLFTNASILNECLFKEIGAVLDDNDRVNFTICGSTQELHQKYRVGSKLENIIKNANALRSVRKIDYAQYIRFTYNITDWKSNKWRELGFTNYYWVESEGQRLFNEGKVKVKSKPIKQPFYDKVFSMLETKKVFNIECESLRSKKVYIDQFGKEYPCYMIAEYMKDLHFNNFSYDNVNDYFCCKLCSRECRSLCDKYDLEFIC